MIHTCLKHFYFNLKHINWHSFSNLWCKAQVFSLNWHDVWSLFINHSLNASLKILNLTFFTLRQEVKWLAKQSDWIISLDCYYLSLSPSQCSQPHLIQQFLYTFYWFACLKLFWGTQLLFHESISSRALIFHGFHILDLQKINLLT